MKRRKPDIFETLNPAVDLIHEGSQSVGSVVGIVLNFSFTSKSMRRVGTLPEAMSCSSQPPNYQQHGRAGKFGGFGYEEGSPCTNHRCTIGAAALFQPNVHQRFESSEAAQHNQSIDLRALRDRVNGTFGSEQVIGALNTGLGGGRSGFR